MEKYSVRKPFTVLVGVILVIVLGVVSFMNTSTDLLPSMNLPYAVIMTTYMGMTPEQVEADITIPIEGRISTVSGISRVQSISSEHFSVVILQFTDSTDMNTASLDMREALDLVSLPESAGKPSLLKLNPNMMPVMVAAVYRDNMSMDEISELTSAELVPSLEGVAGVASVTASGLIKNQLHVLLRGDKIGETNESLRASASAAIEASLADMRKQAGVSPFGQITQSITEAIAGQMAAAGADGQSIGIPAEMLTVDTITGMLSAQNFSMPAGTLDESDDKYMVRIGDRFTDLEEISSMLIMDPEQFGLAGIEPIRLSDVADVFASDNSDTQYTRVNGNPAVMITMQKQTEFSTADITRDIRTRMNDLMDEYDGLEFVILMDQGDYIDVIINSVINNLLMGGLLAIVILILFLRDLRPTVVVAISIPVSVMMAFAAMYFTGVSLNIISMSGLALGVGMLVDNSIVVIENIYRMRGKGVSAATAAIAGTKQVAGAIAASTLTTIAVFFPIVFTEGITRQIFTDLALTIAYSLLASLLVALTVVPAASGSLFRGVKEREGKLFNRFLNVYAGLLRIALRFKWLVIALAALALGLSAYVMMSKGTQFIPEMDSEQIMVSAALPEGSNFEDTVAIAEELSLRIGGIADVSGVGVSVSGGGSGSGMLGMLGGLGGQGGSGMSMYVLLNDSRSMTNSEIAQKIRERGEDLDCEITVSGGSSDSLSMLTGDNIAIRVSGRDLDAIRDTALEVAEIVRSVEGTAEITGASENAAPELRVRVDKEKALGRGLTVAQVFMAVNKMLTAPEKTLNMSLSGKSYEIVIGDGDWQPPDRNALEELEIVTNSGTYARLSDIADVYEDTGFSSINRMDHTRYITVRGSVEEGYNVGLVNGEIERLLNDYIPPDGCTVSIGGEAEAISSAFNDLYMMLALALVFIYLIMVAQFQSLLSPFIVMFTIPLAFTGGFLGLIIAGMPLSVVGMIGLILLTGVVVNNGIVYVDCVNQLRWGGMRKKDALIEAGIIRIRPILMTALTTIVAMSTMTVGMGRGTEMVQPMAVTSVGGLIYATLMTLFIVPAMYDIFHKDRDIQHKDMNITEV